MATKKTTTLGTGYNYKVTNATFNWAKLDPTQPVSPFGAPQWELQIATTDEAVAQDWRDNHLNVKEADGTFNVGLKRKAQNFDGTPKEPAKVVNAAKEPIDMSNIRVANGSTGNVILWVYPWETAGKSGWAASITAVQIVNLIEYKGEMEFDAEAADDDADDIF